MAGTLFVNILFILLLITTRTLQRFVSLLQELQGKDGVPSPMKGDLHLFQQQQEQDVVKTSLFVASKVSTMTTTTTYTSYEDLASSVICQGILPNTVRTQTVGRQQEERPVQHNLVKSSIPSPLNSKPSDNDKVEYVNSYDKDSVYKQGSYVAKGSLKKNLNFWEK